MSTEVPKELMIGGKNIITNDFRLNDSILSEMKQKGKKSVLILAYADWCGACNNFKPTFIEFADKYSKNSNNKALIKVLPMHDDNISNEITSVLDKKGATFKITYFPTILGFDKDGNFFSRYGSSGKNFRTIEDLTEYANSIGDYSIFTESNKDKKWVQIPSF